MRNEMIGVLGELLAISPEQMEELRSEDGQRRLHEGMKKFEGEVQDAIDKMMGGQGGSQGSPQGGLMPHPPVDPRQFPFSRRTNYGIGFAPAPILHLSISAPLCYSRTDVRE